MVRKMEIEDDIKLFKERTLMLRVDVDIIKDSQQKIFLELREIHHLLDKLIKSQNEAILWQTKGKDQRVKNTMPTEMG
jgi:ABC-type iron transport system FetAB ATPase subunit